MDKSVLEIKFYCDDLRKELTVREFMQTLLITLFEEMDSFHGKRPFGNSCWDDDMIVALIKNKAIKGTVEEEFDEDGELIMRNRHLEEDYDEAITRIIKML